MVGLVSHWDQTKVPDESCLMKDKLSGMASVRNDSYGDALLEL